MRVERTDGRDPPPMRGGLRGCVRALVLLGLVLPAFFAASCRSPAVDRGRGEARPSIVLIVLDTVRADALASAATPNLMRFADGAQVFSHARTPAPLTMPAMAALMTGRYAHDVGILGHSRRDRLDGTATLAELAAASGYRTAAVVTNPWLALPSSGFARGFESFTSGRTLGRRRARMRADEVVALGLEILRTHDGRPTLLWLHFMDAHMPYGDEEAATAITRDFSTGARRRSEIYFAPPYDQHEIAATTAAYRRSISEIDTALGPLLAALPDDAVVVVLADHGESLGEHGLHFAHDFTLYDELLRVPLVLRPPLRDHGVESRALRVEEPVSLLDVLPTLCELASLECQGDLDGRTLPGVSDGGDAADATPRIFFAASAPARARYACPWITVPGPDGRWTALIQDRRKLIRIPKPGGTSYRAYDLASDPGELVDRFDAELDATRVERLNAWSRAASARERTGHGDIDRATVRELRSLGYLE